MDSNGACCARRLRLVQGATARSCTTSTAPTAAWRAQCGVQLIVCRRHTGHTSAAMPLSAVATVALKMKLRHERMAKQNQQDENWSVLDSAAALVQATWRAKFARRGAQRAKSFLSRAHHDFWTSDEMHDLLSKDPQQRSDDELKHLHSTFAELEIVRGLSSRLLQLQFCRFLGCKEMRCGKTLFTQGDIGDTLYVILRGKVEYRVANTARVSAENTVWVGHIPRHSVSSDGSGDMAATLSEGLMKRLSSHGVVVAVSVQIKDGLNKSWALVTFEDTESCTKCIESGLLALDADGQEVQVEVEHGHLDDSSKKHKKGKKSSKKKKGEHHSKKPGHKKKAVKTLQVSYTSVVLRSGIGDSFGQQSLRGDGGGRRDATVVCLEDCIFATLCRADYLRITDSLEDVVLDLLRKPPHCRTSQSVSLIRGFFQEVEFFRTLHFQMLQERCCREMKLVRLIPSQVLMCQGDIGEEFFICISGKVDIYIATQTPKPGEAQTAESKFIRSMTDGSSFGELALTGKRPQDRIRTATIVCSSECPTILASLNYAAYMDATVDVEARVSKALAKQQAARHTVTKELRRTEEESRHVVDYLKHESFFVGLQLDGMRRQCCDSLGLQRLKDGETLFTQSDPGVHFYIVLKGSVKVIIDGKMKKTLGRGYSFGELSIVEKSEHKRKRTATIQAAEDCVLATLHRVDYLRVHDRADVQQWIDKFWCLLTSSMDESVSVITFQSYKKLHLRIGKTICPEFNKEEALQSVVDDWQDDLLRHNENGDCLNHQQFCDALFELVDVWVDGETSMVVYSEFLRVLFMNVAGE